MAIEGFLATEEERAAKARIEAATIILSASRGDLPNGLIGQLFQRTAPEDLAPLTPRDLASLAGDTFDFLVDRRPGSPKLRYRTPPVVGGGQRLDQISVLEILNDNMPFLVDSVMGELAEQGIEVRLVAHPIFTVERDGAGHMIGFRGEAIASGQAIRESFIHIHTERLEDDARREQVVHAVEAALADVRRSVADWRPMLSRVGDVIAELRNNSPMIPVEEIAEAVQFLEWLVANNFTFLGIRDYALQSPDGDLEPVFETGLGVLAPADARILKRGGELLVMTPEIRAFLKERHPLIVSKSNLRSRVHRRVHMDYIGVKRFDEEGRLTGEVRIVGLFTSTAYTRQTRTIPYLRRKVDVVMGWAGLDPDSHSGKALANVLETYPRDELFQIADDLLYRHATMILQLEERPRVRVLMRRDRFDRYASVLVYVPRDLYDTRARILIGQHLARVYGGRISAFYPAFPEGTLARVHYIVSLPAGGASPREPDRTDLETQITDIVRTWADGLNTALGIAHDPVKANALAVRYRSAFPVGYRDRYGATAAVADIRVLDLLKPERPNAIDFVKREGDGSRIGLKVWSLGKALALSTRVPMLENMGFRVVDETTFEIEPAAGDTVFMHDMTLVTASGATIDLDALDQRLEAALIAVLRGEAESDGYNALVLNAGLPWRDIALLRTLSRFLRQARVPYSQDYMWQTLNRHGAIAGRIAALFHARFDPRLDVTAQARAAAEEKIRADIETALADVASLDEDRILRRFVNAVGAAIRTNFYRVGRDGMPGTVISVKFESRRLDDLPEPRPLYEIFVSSPRVEGVHLRFGKVARGGLRWSDRPQDFRTEVLGLVKAQQVKNAVIVPVGAKGGFVPKQLPAGPREAIQAEGTAAYKVFVSSLIEITDNLDADGKVVPPVNVVRHDGDDPYLVVAADKGTATFSDTANGLAREAGFWLDDAFASGGSAGYDHKKMAITARGAFEAVRRHFREIDIDIDRQTFSVAGVGDMSGDVFGNGMLLSRNIRLLAAFDHRDIFLDPNPDPEASFNERKRLFDLPRSSWADYDRNRLSTGGGIYSRSLKAIDLSQQMRAILKIGKDTVTPAELMSAILKAEVDLLWFGGIGTYVRAASETDEQVGDRANDAVRIVADDLRCRIIGEGANLGMTQKGRIAAAMRGVRLNTDAIDNSGGVNSSDVEVNVKIALAIPERQERITRESRNEFLVRMTDEVAAIVLRNNSLQTLALSLAERRGQEDLGFQQRLMQTLESRGQLSRGIEFLPDDLAIAERRRAGQALTRPELAVLLAYAKLTLFDALIASPVPDDPYLSRELARYFPKQLQARFPDAIQAHRLKREIVATQLSNSMINRGGPSLVPRMADQTGASAPDIAAAFAAVRDSYGMTALNTRIDDLDNKVPGALQLDLYADVQNLLLDRMVWFLRGGKLDGGLAPVITRYQTGIDQLRAGLNAALPLDARNARDARVKDLAGRGVPEDLATEIASLPWLAAAPDIVGVADTTKRPLADIAATYFATGAFFRLDRLIEAGQGVKITDYFDRLAVDRALDSLAESQRRLTGEIASGGLGGPAALDAWVAPRAQGVERIRAAIHDIAGSGLTISKLTVAASLLGDLVSA